MSNAADCATFVLDRVEGDRAVLEVDGQTIDVPASALPAGAREGDAFALSRVDDQGALADAQARLARLRQGSGGGSEFDL